MSRKFLTPVSLTAGSSLPASGVAGDLFFKTDESKIYVHNGTTWIVSQVDLEALNVSVDTTNFNNNLSASDNTVQAALETLDELTSAGSVSGLSDTELTSLANGDVLVYNSDTSKWVNAQPSNYGNIDGGNSLSIYSGYDNIDGGTSTAVYDGMSELALDGGSSQ